MAGAYIKGNSFMNGFMQGYSFLDDIAARKKAEERLEQRLAEEREFREYTRQRQYRIDREVQEDTRRRRTREDELYAREDEQRQVNEAIAGIDPNDFEGIINALTPYAKNPAAAAAIAQARSMQTRRADDLRLARGPAGASALSAGAAGVAAGGNVQTLPTDPNNPATMSQMPTDPNTPAQMAPMTQLPNGLVPNAGLPQADPVDAAQARVSKEQLEALAVTDPQGAAALRDQQKALDQEYNVPAPLMSDPEVGASISTPRKDQIRKAKDFRDVVREQWEAALDINNPNGDNFRQLPPATQVGQYYRERSQLTSDQKARGDKLMAPHIEATIAQSKEILNNPDLDPNSLDAANARRKLRDAYAARNARADYKVLEANGITPSGLPVGRNGELSDRVIAAAVQQPGSPAPATVQQAKAEDRVLERGPTNGRISDAFASAAWRKYSRGEIDYATFVSYVKTGKPPPNVQSALQSVKDATGAESVYSITTDKNTGQVLGVQKVIQGGGGTGGRNVLKGEALTLIKQYGESLAEEVGKPTLAGDFTREFADVLGKHEAMATLRGYDYSNISDVSQLWSRWKQLQIVAQAIDDEVRFRGNIGTTFEDTYGMTVAQALFTEFDPGELSELEVPGSTTLGFGGETPRLDNLRGIDPQFFEVVKQRYPDMANMTNEQILEYMSQEQ